MSHITALGAGIFSDLSIAVPSTDLSNAAIAALDTDAEFQALFATAIESIGGTKAAGTFVRVKNVRTFPSMGVPPNVVNVPGFGSKTSKQIQGQSDAPSMELTLNYVPAEWAKTAGNILGNMVGDGKQYAFRFTLLNDEPTGVSTDTKYSSTTGGVGTVGNSQYYWIGKLDALLVNPQLTDANTASLTITIQSAFFGAYTNT